MASTGMISFNRTIYSSEYADGMKKSRDERAFTDFKIHIKDDTIPCHKFILASHSPMLKAMLLSDMNEAANQEVRLDWITLDIMNIILDYMYFDCVNVHSNQLVDLIAAADYFQMEKLKKMALGEVKSVVDSDNAISWWREAGLMNYDDIGKCCEYIMAKHIDEVSQQSDFLNLGIADLQYFVSNISLTSDLLLDTVMKWVSHKEERVSHVDDLLHRVNMETCSSEGLKAVTKTYESVFDKVPMVYKRLNSTLTDISDKLINKCKPKSTLFIVGGYVDKICVHESFCEVKKTGTNSEFEIPPEKISRRSSVCKIPQGFVITGGKGSKRCHVYVASTRSWFRLNDMLIARTKHASICVNDILYVIGGHVGSLEIQSGLVDFMSIGNRGHGRWQSAPPLPIDVLFPLVANIGTNLYVLDTYESRELYFFDMNCWIQVQSPPIQDYTGVSMTAVRDRLYVAGGYERICAWYQPETNTWCRAQQPSLKHLFGALIHHQDTLLLLGGSCRATNKGTDEVEEYDIEHDTWSASAFKMQHQGLRHHIAIMMDMHAD